MSDQAAPDEKLMRLRFDTTRGVDVLWPKKLYPKLKADGPMTSKTINEIHQQIAVAFPPA